MSPPPADLRWRGRRSTFRVPDEVFRPAGYEVADLPDPQAKACVEARDYSARYVAARFRFGLFRQGRLVGAAVFSHPCNDGVLTNVFGGHLLESAELGRFVLLDEVPFNGESWVLARCLHALRRRGLRVVVLFSDPVQRTTADGVLLFPGHVGTVYQACDAAYLGRGEARTLRLLPDATVLSDRAVQPAGPTRWPSTRWPAPSATTTSRAARATRRNWAG